MEACRSATIGGAFQLLEARGCGGDGGEGRQVEREEGNVSVRNDGFDLCDCGDLEDGRGQ